MSLQRRQPMKRSPLKRGSASLERKAMPKSRKQIPAKSAKRRAEAPARAALYDVVRARQGPVCAWPKCHELWADVHEVHTRGRGGSHVDERVVIGLCRAHNTYAGDETRRAECAGGVVPSWAAVNDLEGAMQLAASLRAGLDRNDPQPCPWRRNGEPCTSTDPTQRARCEALQGP